MKLALIAEKSDHKLNAGAYSQAYFDMFIALVNRFGKDTMVYYGDCSAKDIDADVIFFFDIHSSHNIKIEGIEHHPALKLSYFNDPHQRELRGHYKDGSSVHKRGAEQRVVRAVERGVDYIVVNDVPSYLKYIEPIWKSDYIYFPAVCDERRFDWDNGYYVMRKTEVLANGATWAGDKSCYDFRNWAFNRPNVSFVEHCIKNKSTPAGRDYSALLSKYKAGLALCDWFPVNKYFEIPLAGCVSFMQWNSACEGLGFVDNENAVFVNKKNFDYRVNYFLNHPIEYLEIAEKGRNLVKNNYTAQKFAEYIFKRCENHCKGLSRG